MYCGICVVLLLGCLGYNCNQVFDLDCIVVFVLYCYFFLGFACNQVVDLVCIVVFVLYCYSDVWVMIVIKLLTLFVLLYFQPSCTRQRPVILLSIGINHKGSMHRN